jgi:hypothetical protein
MYAELSEVYQDYKAPTETQDTKHPVNGNCSEFIDHYFDCENCQFNFLINRHQKYNLRDNIRDVIIIILLILLMMRT